MAKKAKKNENENEFHEFYDALKNATQFRSFDTEETKQMVRKVCEQFGMVEPQNDDE